MMLKNINVALKEHDIRLVLQFKKKTKANLTFKTMGTIVSYRVDCIDYVQPFFCHF